MKTKKHMIEVEIPTGRLCRNGDRCEYLQDIYPDAFSGSRYYKCRQFPNESILMGNVFGRRDVYRCAGCIERFGLEEE